MAHLVGGYFHQDRPLEYGSWQEAVDDFVARSPGRARTFPGEIDEVLTGATGEREVEDLLTRLGSFVHAPSLDDNATGWLLAVQDRIRAQMGRSID